MAGKPGAQERNAEVKKGDEGRYPIIKAGGPHAVEETGIAFETIMKAVSDGIARAARGAGTTGITVLEAINGIVRTSLRETPRIGSDLIMGTKAIMMGVIRGGGERDIEALKILSHTARSVVRQTAAMKGDLGAAVTGLVRGAMAGAEHIGVDPAKAAWAVSGAAIEEAYYVGSLAGQGVRKALKENIGGFKVASPEFLKG